VTPRDPWAAAPEDFSIFAKTLGLICVVLVIK
jgi:hypothetical protein